jgi:methyl-accepting chemotaxis protein
MKTISFKTKVLALTASVFLLSIAIIITYNAISRLNDAKQNAVKNATLTTDNLVSQLKDKVNYTFDILRSVNDNLAITKDKLSRDIVNEMLIEMLKNNPDFFGTYTLWEPDAFDKKDKQFAGKPGHDKTGRFIPYWTRKAGDGFRQDALMDYETEGESNYYLPVRKSKKECIIDPLLYPVDNKNVLMISLVSPILINGEFMGITGVDYELSFMQRELMEVQSKVFNGKSDIEILSNMGKIVASSISPDSIGKSILDLDIENVDDILKKIQRGKSETSIKDDNLVITKSFVYGKTVTPWQIRFTLPYSEITKESRSIIFTSILGGIILLIIGLLIIYLLVNRLTKPLNVLVEKTQKISEGDLTGRIEITRDDEIGLLAKSFNTMVIKLNEIIATIIESTNSFTIGTSQISSTAEQVAQGANEQASSSEEVSASVLEMAANIQQNTENSKQTEIIANEAYQGIMEVANKAKQSLDATNTVTQKITVINEIAEKTDILAINAAIEAARAGEHGKGFAVVAAEVRKLAEISQKAAKEINEITLFNSKITGESGVLMGEVIPKIQKTSILIQEITAASIEQSSGTEQISKAIEQLSQVTQQNSAAAEQMSSSSEELASQAEVLKDTVMFFKIDRLSFLDTKEVKTYSPDTQTKAKKTKKKGISSQHDLNIDLSDDKIKDPDFENY